jgi:hypothetical protein
MTDGDFGINTVLIVGPIASERGQRAGDLVEQRADLSAVIDIFRGQRRGHDLTGAGIDAEMQFAPGAAGLDAVLLNQPLARAA